MHRVQRLEPMTSSRSSLPSCSSIEATTSEDKRSKSGIKIFFDYEIEGATDGFSDSSKIGEGGFDAVYRGHLDGTEIDVKILDTNSEQGIPEFHQELEVLGRIRHPNLVKLIGVCFKLRALVYEFVPNGSLEDLLKKSPEHLTWQMRTRIVYDTCSALLFLHSNKPQPVLHGDLKPANILLDGRFNIKLADFGLCHVLPEDTNTIKFHKTSRIQGTHWYIDPDYLGQGKLSPRCDVYSFGVTILRILTGAPPAKIVMKV